MRRVATLLILGLSLAACAAPAPAPRAAARAHAKPTAPVEVTLGARDLGRGEWEVTLRATPTLDARALALRLVAPAGSGATPVARAEAGATARGTTRALTARVHVPPEGLDVAGGAQLRTGPARSASRAATMRLGRPAPARVAPVSTVVLPSGDRVAVVRP
jgi:hypothetical protein